MDPKKKRLLKQEIFRAIKAQTDKKTQTDGVLRAYRVNIKTHRQSYKIKKTIENPPEQWKIFRNTHGAIVDEDTFQRVQELRRNKRRPARTDKSNLFSGVAYCAERTISPAKSMTVDLKRCLPIMKMSKQS